LRGASVRSAKGNFCSKCFEVEELALLRVSQLAAKVSSEPRQPSTSAQGWSGVSSSVTSVGSQSKLQPFPAKSRTRKSGRPSTAPSSDSDASRRRLFSDPSLGSSPLTRISADNRLEGLNLSSTNERRLWPQPTNQLSHFKSTSTDSVPSHAVPGTLGSTRPLRTTDLTDVSDDAGRRKRGLLRGILRR